MKKIFVAMLALAAATACSNNELVSVNQEAIGFDNAFINNSVRSIEDPSYSNTKFFSDFAVYGFVSADNQTPAAIFDGTQVSGPAWTYVGTQYWMDEADYDFHAVAPLTGGNWTNAVATTETLSLSFTNNGETDLLYAINDYGKYNYNENKPVGKVGFDFRHALAKVKFSFLNNYNATNSYLRVSDIHILNAYETANATFGKNYLSDVELLKTVWRDHDGDLILAFGDANTTASNDEAQPFAFEAEVESHRERFLIPCYTLRPFEKNGEPTEGYRVTFTVEVLVGENIEDAVVVKTYNHTVAANLKPVAGYAYDLKATLSAENVDPYQAQEPIEFTVTSIDNWADIRLNDKLTF